MNVPALALHNARLQVESKAAFDVRTVVASEALSAPFQVVVGAVSLERLGGAGNAGAHVDLDAVISRPATLAVTMASGLDRVWSGIIHTAELVRYGDRPGEESSYRLELVPDLWLLSQRRGNRIFQHKKIPHIVDAVLAEWRIEAKWHIDEALYREKEYCLQYGESDLDFVHRLLEEVGISYYFVNDDAAPKSRLVFNDAPQSTKRTVSAPWTDNPNEAHGTEFFHGTRLAHRLRPGLVTLGDYNFRRPKAPLAASSTKIDGPEGSREAYAFVPGGFLVETGAAGKGPADEKVADDKSTTLHDAEKHGKMLAERALEALRNNARTVAFRTSLQNLRPGGVFAMTGHPQPEIDDQDMLCLRTVCSIDAVGEWHVRGEAVAASRPYRPAKVTPKPRVPGLQAAFVVGPKDKEIYCDEFGRVRVHFPWDRLGEYDDRATCWLRVSSSWAGAQFGALMLPRVGHEVIVDFFGGDPDQPIVVGRVHDVPSPAPYLLPEHQTKSTWQTNTTPNQEGSKSFNEILFEDKQGSELVYLQAQRNYMTLTKRNETERTGETRTMVVGHHRLAVVGSVAATQVGERHLVQMVEAKDLKILELGDPAFEPKTTFFELRKDKIVLTTGSADVVLDGPDVVIRAKKGVRFSADKNLIIKGAMVYLNCLPAAAGSVGASQKVADEADKPKGDVMNAILELFQEDAPPEKLAAR